MAYVIPASPNVPADWASHATDLFRSTARRLILEQTGLERPPCAHWGGCGDPRSDGFGRVLPGQGTIEQAIVRVGGGVWTPTQCHGI